MSGPRRWRFTAAGMIVAAALLGGALGWLWSDVRAPVYAATATLMVQTVAPARQAYDAARADAARAPGLAALSVGPERLSQVANELQLAVSLVDLSQQVNARTRLGTPFIDITARAADPREAALFANRLAELAIESGGASSTSSGTQLMMVESAENPTQPAYSREPVATATGALVLGVIALAIVVWRRGHRGLPTQASPREGSSREIAIGAGLAVVILLSLGLEAPESAAQVLALLAAGLGAISPPSGLALLAIVFPFPDSEAFGPLTLNLLIIGGITYGTILDAALRRAIPQVGLGTLAVAAYLGLALVASLPPLNGLEGDRAVAAIARFMQLGAGLVLVLVGAYHFARHDPRPYIVLIAVSTAFAAALAISQLASVDFSGLPVQGLFSEAGAANAVRPSGPFQNANYFGHFLALGLVATLGILLTIRRLQLRLLLSISALAIASALLFASLSRGALLAAVPGILTLVWTWLRPRIALVATTAMFVVAATLYPLLLEARVDRSETATSAATEAGVAASDQQRFDAVTAAIPLFLIDPVLGVGFGQYHFESTRYVGSSAATSSHNQYLNILAEQGLVGIAAFSALVAALILGLRRARSGVSKLALAVLATYAADGMFIEPINSLQTSTALWLVLGAGLAPATLRQAARVASTLTPQSAKTPAMRRVEAVR